MKNFAKVLLACLPVLITALVMLSGATASTGQYTVTAEADPPAGGTIVGTTGWESTGGATSGYSINSLAWDGSCLYAGTNAGLWRYDPVLSAWTDAGGAFGSYGIASLAWDGSGLYAGTYTGVWRFDPLSSTWTDTGFSHAAISLAWDGSGLYAGSAGYGMWRYDPAASTWTEKGGGGVEIFTNSLAWDGSRLYIANYARPRSTAPACSWVKRYDPSTSAWTTIYETGYTWPMTGTWHNLAWSGSGLYATGMGTGLCRYDPLFSTWTSIGWPGASDDWPVSLARDGSNLLAGTRGGAVWSYCPATNTWEQVGDVVGSHPVTSVARYGSVLYAGTAESVSLVNTTGYGLWRYGTTVVTETYDDGAAVNLTATPNPGCHFVNWTEGGVEVSADASCSFTATADRNLVANFVLNPAPSITSVAPSSGVNLGIAGMTLEGTGFLDGATVTLKKEGAADIAATGVVVESGGKITCIVNLFGVQTGAWDVVVTNPNGQSAVLAGAFTVNPLISCGSGASGTLLLVGGMVGLLSLGQHSRRRRRRK